MSDGFCTPHDEVETNCAPCLRQKLQIAEQAVEVKQPGFDMYYHQLFKEERKRALAAEGHVMDLLKVLDAAKNVNDNDGEDQGWKLRYALQDYAEAREKVAKK